MDKEIVVSVKAIFAFFLILIGFYLIYRLGSIIGMVGMALLVTISLEHTVKFFTNQTFFNKPISRSAAVVITYVMLLIIVALILSIGFDPVITQSQKLIAFMSKQQKVINLGEKLDISFSDLISNVVKASGGVLTTASSLFSNITAIVSLLILSIYLSIDWEHIKSSFANLFVGEKKGMVEKMLLEIEENVGHWINGQLILMLFIGIFSYFALIIAGVSYPLALGIMSGMLEIVPIIGPVVSAIVAGLVALADSPVKALLVISMFTIIQQLESNVLVPKVMQKVSGFSPVVILIGLLIGGNLFGIAGAIVTVPVLMVGAVVIKYIKKMYY